MLKAIAIDDEPIALDVMQQLTGKVTFVDMAGYFTNAFAAMQFLQTNAIDLIFLDIKMPDISGFDFLKSIPNPPMVIFTTAYSEHALDGFEMNGIDYLLKPFSLTRFLRACNKAYEYHTLRQNGTESHASQPQVFIKSGYDTFRLNLGDILYAEACGNYVQFVLENQKIVTRLTMAEAEALLSPTAFLRIHRSYIVARKHIRKFDRKSLWIGTHELPIGPLYLPDIEKLTFKPN